MAIYVTYNGKKIKGNVTAKGFDGCIECDSMSFGVGRGISMEAGNVANREVHRPSISEVTISKAMDSSSGGLFKEAVSGTEGVEVIVDIVQTGTKEVQKFAQYKLSDCLISSYSINASSGGAPFESISISFAKIEADLSNADKANKNKGQMKVGYDIAAATPL